MSDEIYTPTVKFDELKDGRARLTKTTSGYVVLLRQGEEVLAYTPICPHANGDLTYGAIYDGTVECPLHGWRFNLRSGECVDPAGGQSIRVYPAKIEDGTVCVHIGKPKWMEE